MRTTTTTRWLLGGACLIAACGTPLIRGNPTQETNPLPQPAAIVRHPHTPPHATDTEQDTRAFDGLLTNQQVWTDAAILRLHDAGPDPQAAAAATGAEAPARIDSDAPPTASEPIPPQRRFAAPEPASAILLAFGVVLASRRFRQHL